MNGLETFEPLDTEETLYPFAIEKNVCGLDRLSRVIGAFLTFLIALKLVKRRRFVGALVMLGATIALTLNAVTQRCILSEVLGVSTCEGEGREN